MDFSWDYPMPGDDYQPGDSIIGQWRTSRAIDSPTIRLCVADEDHITAAEKNCGSAVHPDVQQSGQTYRVSLVTPEVTSPYKYYLVLGDAHGNVWSSSIFLLSPTKNAHSESTPSNFAYNAEISPMNSSVYERLSNAPPSTATFIIPLSISAVILLIASLACLYRYRYRKLRLEHRPPTIPSTPINGGLGFSHLPRKTFILNNHHTTTSSPSDEKDIFTTIYRSPPSQRPSRHPTTRSTHHSGHISAPFRLVSLKSSLSPRLPRPFHLGDESILSEDIFQTKTDENDDTKDSVGSRSLLSSSTSRPVSSLSIPSIPPRLHVRRRGDDHNM